MEVETSRMEKWERRGKGGWINTETVEREGAMNEPKGSVTSSSVKVKVMEDLRFAQREGKSVRRESLKEGELQNVTRGYKRLLGD